MDVHDEKIGNLIYRRRQYFVPIWQREYSWAHMQWDELWSDMKRLYDEIFNRNVGKDMNHFMGSIVLKPKELGGVEKYTVIDGQQRIATLLILLALIRDKAKTDNPALSNTIQTSYLLNSDIKSLDEQFKLRPSANDDPAFVKIMNGESDIQGRLGLAYARFERKLREEKDENGNGYDLQKLKELIIDNLRTVEIILAEKDDPNRIFETLNSRGLELEQADLVRNFFMMKIRNENQAEELYKGTWLPMQQSLSTIRNLTEFFRHYLAKETHNRVKQDEIYRLLQQRLKWSSENEIIAELQRMKKFSEYYQRLLFPQEEPNSEIQKRLERLNQWKVSTAYPLLLKAYSASVSEDDLCRLVDIIESFVVRRHFCNVKTNSLNSIFTSLCGLEDDELVDSVEKELAAYRWNYRWPDDDEFVKSFAIFPIYKSSYAKCHLVLSSLERSFEHPERIDLGNLEIEHIMPRVLNDWWKAHVGADWEKVHAELLHTVGNLTFVAGEVNPQLSNSPFPEKKDWFMKTKVNLSEYLQALNKWTRPEILERGKLLSQNAVEIWKHP